jgi:hypothetical protein
MLTTDINHGRNMIAPAFARSADALGTLTVSAGRP